MNTGTAPTPKRLTVFGSGRALRWLAVAIVATLSASACVSAADDPLPEGSASSDTADTISSAVVDDDDQVGGDGQAGGDDGVDQTADLPVGAVADPGSLAELEAVACSYDELVPVPVEPTCYEIAVPERWDDPDPEDQVVIQLAVFEGDGSAEDPIIYFDGGPGGQTLDSLQFTFGALVEPYLGSRDYIVFDQRGVGLSEPSLACSELIDVSLADLAGEIAPDQLADVTLAALDSCRGRLVASGVDLEAYNSVASANDVEAIRSTLGYEQLNVVGISYGTRLAQTYMRMYPDSARSVVLDSIFPTSADLWSELNLGAIRAFEQMFDGCSASSACSAEFPDFEDRFFQLLDELDAEPIETEATHLLTGETTAAQIDGTDVMELVFGALYDQGRFSLVPQMVEDSLAGDHEILELFTSITVTNFDAISSGMQLAVECNEEIPFEPEDVYEANLVQDAPYDRLDRLDGGVSLFTVCEAWPSGTAPEVESLLVTSDIPSLLLAGQYDPITPPAGVDTVKAGLVNSFEFILPHEGHGIAPTDCGAELINAFIDDPTVELDGSCVATSPEPGWTGEVVAGPIEFVEFEGGSLNPVSGLRPEGWTDVGNGAFTRGASAIDPTTLVVQVTSGLPADTLVELLASQLEVELTATEPIEVDGNPWEIYTSGPDEDPAIRLGVGVDDGVLVLLVADADEMESLYSELFVSVASAAEPAAS